MGMLFGMAAPIMGLSFVSSLGIIALVIYTLATIKNSRREIAQRDPQVGLKSVLFSLLFLSAIVGVVGVFMFVWYLLSGTKAGSDIIKTGLAVLLGGGGLGVGIYLLLLPRTNFRQFGDTARITVGMCTFVFGMASLFALVSLFLALFEGFNGPWAMNSVFLTAVFVSLPLFYFTVMAFGKMSNWATPVRPPRVQSPPTGGNPGGGMGGPQPIQQQGYPQPGAAPQPGYQAPAPGGYQPPPQAPAPGYSPPTPAGYPPPGQNPYNPGGGGQQGG